AINENTSEIQVMLDYLQEMEAKIEKLSQRIDKLQLVDREKPLIFPLTREEKKVFLVFYTEEASLTFRDIALKSNIHLSLVSDLISSLVQKGIPLQRSHFNGSLFLKLEPGFKELQAKENVVNLSLQSFLE
ncbi:MAG TPA: hypothetical protein VJI98_04970, partial [Candidatus Nanoarchaeia archaeon]|nr:hypothetical protein [Candidatus Nanoarchaeia archaeon]